LDVC